MIIEETDLCSELDVTDEGNLLCLQDHHGDYINVCPEMAAKLAKVLKHYAETGELPE